MSTHEQLSVSDIADEVRGWVEEGRAILSARTQIAEAGDAAVNTLRAAAIPVRRDNQVMLRVLPLRPRDAELIGSVARQAQLPAASTDLEYQLHHLTRTIAAATDAVRTVTGFQRFFSFGGSRENGRKAAALLTEYREWYLAHGISGQLNRLAPGDDSHARNVRIEDALAGWVGLVQRLGETAGSVTLEPSTTFAILPNAMKIIQRAAQEEESRRAAAVDAGNEVRRMETGRMLAEMPVERLREATRDKIRVNALVNLGIRTVLDVLANEDQLQYFAGIGETSAIRIRGAARTILQSTYEEMPTRIDIRNRSTEHTELLRCLRTWDATRKAAALPGDLAQIQELVPLAGGIDKDVTHALVACPSRWTIDDFRHSIQTVVRCARRMSEASDSAQADDPWDDFLSRPADYFALLAELGFITEDEQKSHGDLPEDIVEAVRALELKTEHLNVSLRGYQSFGARFALTQRKVIIGDEMGLGKTVEAIAVLAHLRATGSHHALVICPAAVVTNWTREVQSKSKLAAHRVHGPDRTAAVSTWIRRGGIAVTTFETLNWLTTQAAQLPDLGCVVVDEAHYIKNPAAQRTARTTRIINSCERAVLLTGTPLENRIDEFRHLVGYLRPDLVIDANEFAPKRFRRQVAPAYLRRNQEDVLTELPELVEVEEWLGMSREDFTAYRSAVALGNFMAVRQSAMLTGNNSIKLQRLCEIVEEAEDNGRRVVVFSHFLEVLQQVVAALPGRVFGPLTGSVPAAKRQTIIDQFSAAQHGAVLVAQILAGGVGLNIQAASVVIICEPQLKPTTEWQAIARAHRMGQVESVQVHRLLSEEGVDQRLHQLLARKREVFEEFARQSETAESAPEAYDVSETELAKEVIAAERERLFGRPVSGDSSNRPGGSDSPEHNDLRTSSVRIPVSDHTEPVVPELLVNSPTSFAADTSSEDCDELTTPSSGAARAGSATPYLLPYNEFSGTFLPVAETAFESVIDNVVCIVEVEGPILGYRLHDAYREASGDWDDRECSRILNRAITRAEASGWIVSDNPLGAEGVKPRTFRLATQPVVIARELGPRSLAQVPPAEREYHH